jgi:hypothetical protein
MMSGGGDLEEEARKRGIPADILAMAEGFQDCLVFPDNWPVVGVFRDISTQWRVGPGGILGLDYNVLPMIFRLRGIGKSDRTDIFDGLQVMEYAAIESIRERSK